MADKPAFDKTFDAQQPFHGTIAANALLQCYKDLKPAEAQQLESVEYLSYRERSAASDEKTTSSCSARKQSTYISERTVDVSVDELTNKYVNDQVTRNRKDECEEEIGFGATSLVSATLLAVTFDTPASYNTASCSWLFGKNTKYRWSGRIRVTFAITPIYSPDGCTPGVTDCSFLGHKFLPPKLDAITEFEKTNYWSALVDPKALLGAVAGFLVGGPGGAAFGATLGAGISATELKNVSGNGVSQIQNAGDAQLRQVLRRLIDDDVMASLSRAVKRLQSEIENIDFAYLLDPTLTGFVSPAPQTATYQFHDVGSYCSHELPAVLAERQRVKDLIAAIAKCEESTVEVKNGDRLWDIAKDKLGDGYAFLAIAARNHISPRSYLRPGTVLVVPSRCDLCKQRDSHDMALIGSALETLADAKGIPRHAVRQIKTLSGNPNLIYPYESIDFSSKTPASPNAVSPKQ